MVGTYINFTSQEKKTGVLVCLDIRDRLVFWCEYMLDSYECAFHDNSPIIPAAVNGKTAYIVPEATCKDILVKAMKATAKTIAGRYAGEIEEFLHKEYPYFKY